MKKVVAMKAKLIKAWSCAPEGHTVLRFNINDIIEGNIAVMAMEAGAAIEHKEITPLDTKTSSELTLESSKPKRLKK
jgi:hypothetical protein